MTIAIASAVFAVALASAAADQSGHLPNTAATVVANQCEIPSGFAPPFSRVYHLRDGRTLVFVAVAHSSDPTDTSHRLISQTIERFKPGLIYIEGIGTGSDAEIAFQQAAAHRQWRTGSIQETLYTVKLAGEHGIAFASWDYRPGERMRLAVAQGFALPDVLGATLLHDGIAPEDLSTFPARRDIAYATSVGPIEGFDYAAWFRRNYPIPPRPEEKTPCGTGITSRILKAESDARTARLADLLTHPKTLARVVMVEAGANHWLALQVYLRSQSTTIY